MSLKKTKLRNTQSNKMAINRGLIKFYNLFIRDRSLLTCKKKKLNEKKTNVDIIMIER